MNTLLNTFPAPLLRLILCGGKGLAPAWGPLMERVDDEPENDRRWTLDRYGHVMNREHLGSRTPMSEGAAPWFMPLDAASPWPARLAMVAAWMASAWMPAGVSAEVVLGECWLHLYTYSGGVADSRAWACDNGGNIEPGAVRLDLRTLPQHLQTHPPAIALLLALYDVPEIRARVETP